MWTVLKYAGEQKIRGTEASSRREVSRDESPYDESYLGVEKMTEIASHVSIGL
jgi:hypothetical protein